MRIQAINQTIPSNNKVNFQSKYKKEATGENQKYPNNTTYTNIKRNIILPLILSQGIMLSTNSCTEKRNNDITPASIEVVDNIHSDKQKNMIKDAMACIRYFDKPEEVEIKKDKIEIDGDDFEKIKNNTYKDGKKTISIEKLPDGNYNVIYKNTGKALFNDEVKMYGRRNLLISFDKNGKMLSMEDAARVNKDNLNDNFLILNPISEEMKESLTTAFGYFLPIVQSDFIPGNIIATSSNSLVGNFIGKGMYLGGTGTFQSEFLLANTLNWKTPEDESRWTLDLKVNLQPDGGYDIVFTKVNEPEFKNEVCITSFDDNHKKITSKSIENVKEYKAALEEIEKERKAQQIAGEKFFNDMTDLPILKTIDNEVMKKLIMAIGLKDLEYVDNGNERYNIFLKKGNDNFDITLKQTAPKAYTGIAQKLMPDGTSQIYLLKLEHIETNKSNKLRVSRIHVVQDGLDINSPTYKKNIKETIKGGNNTSTTTHGVKGKSRIDMLIPMIPDFLYPGKNYEGDITSKVVKTIDEVISETNSEGKIVTVFSVSKDSGKVDMNGKAVF